MSRTETILVIDDNPIITRLLEDVLAQEGYRVVASNDPTSCEPLVEQEHPDLLVLDICMPGIDGWELCRRLREEHQMPILVLTVLTDTLDIERTFQAGADAYMRKPFALPEFLKRVRSLLRKGIRRIGTEE